MTNIIVIPVELTSLYFGYCIYFKRNTIFSRGSKKIMKQDANMSSMPRESD